VLKAFRIGIMMIRVIFYIGRLTIILTKVFVMLNFWVRKLLNIIEHLLHI